METYTARRAEIVDTPPHPDPVADATDGMFLVVNKQTGAVVGKASTMSRARLILDRHDNAHGSYIHKIVRPITPTPAG